MRSGSTRRAQTGRRSGRAGRVNGLVFFLLLVLVGVLAGVGLFRWRSEAFAPRIELGSTGPHDAPEARLRFWFERYGQPQIHNALLRGRFSSEHSWLVTHICQPEPVPGVDYEPELWGIDLTGLGPEISRVEGLRVVVKIPGPRLLQRTAEIEGSLARGVPIYRPGEALPPADELARARVLGHLSPILTALSRKLPEVELAIEVVP